MKKTKVAFKNFKCFLNHKYEPIKECDRCEGKTSEQCGNILRKVDKKAWKLYKKETE